MKRSSMFCFGILFLSVIPNARSFAGEEAEYAYLSDPANANKRDFKERLRAYLDAPFFEGRRTATGKNRRVETPGEWKSAGSLRTLPTGSPQDRLFAGETAVQVDDGYYMAAANLRYQEVHVTFEPEFVTNYTRRFNFEDAAELLLKPHIANKPYYFQFLLDLYRDDDRTGLDFKFSYGKGKAFMLTLFTEHPGEVEKLADARFLKPFVKQALATNDLNNLEAALRAFGERGISRNSDVRILAEAYLDHYFLRDKAVTSFALGCFGPTEIKPEWVEKFRASVESGTRSRLSDLSIDWLSRDGGAAKQWLKSWKSSSIRELSAVVTGDPKVYDYFMLHAFIPEQIRFFKKVEAFAGDVFSRRYGAPKDGFVDSAFKSLKKDTLLKEMLGWAEGAGEGATDAEIAAYALKHGYSTVCQSLLKKSKRVADAF